MIVAGKGHVLRALGFVRKRLGVDAHMEAVCGAKGSIRDGELNFYYPELIASDANLLKEVIACPTCRELING